MTSDRLKEISAFLNQFVRKYWLVIGILFILGISVFFGWLVWLGTLGQYLAGIGLLWAAYIAYKRLILDAQKTALILDINSIIIKKYIT